MTNSSLATHNYESCECKYFTTSVCSSCTLLGIPAGERLASKVARVRDAFSANNVPTDRLPTDIVIPSHPWGSRNKAKLSTTGTMAAPIIGIVRSDLSGVDLSDCALMTDSCKRFIADLPDFIAAASLPPYDIKDRRGELKGVQVIMNHDYSEGIVRFILRSSESIPRIKKLVQTIQSRHPWASVISCNIQPLPAAIPEGPEEVLLTTQRFIQERYGQTTLLYAPSSFIQVTHEVAEQLYKAAADSAQRGQFREVLDLFCGVGGFSLSVAPFAQHVTGVELSATAIESAQTAAQLNRAPNVDFLSADTEDFLNGDHAIAPDLVIVNPPRRGLSPGIIEKLITLAPRTILYSSCNPETFARDVQMFIQTGQFSLENVRLFDMFPLSFHCEVLGTLSAPRAATRSSSSSSSSTR